MHSLKFGSDPQVQFLSQLLEELGRGSIGSHDSSDALVWDLSQRLELLRSVREGVPMGAIMIWRTQLSSGITTYHIKGLPKAPETPSVLHQYLLDGVQRLTTLYDALFPKSFADAEDEAAVDAEAEEAYSILKATIFAMFRTTR